MPETRMLPMKKPRSTGIERTNLSNGRPTPTGTGTSSHVSAAPGVGARVHQHVLDARNPAAAARATPGRQDARVEIVHRNSGGAATFDRPTVQLLDRAAGAVDAVGDRGGEPQDGRREHDEEFDIDQLNLIGSLLGQYEEGVLAIGDHANSKMARAAIDIVVRRIKRLHAAPSARPVPRPRPAVGTAQAAQAAHAADPVEPADATIAEPGESGRE